MSDDYCATPLPGEVYPISDNNRCPLCRHDFHSSECPHFMLHYAAEIARLRADLEQSAANMEMVLGELDTVTSAFVDARVDRDEARRWARRMYRNWLLSEAW